MSIEIKIINQLSDNYCYLIISKTNNQAIVVDPADEKPIINFLEKNKINLIAILITHHHSDHTSGIKGLRKNYTAKVYSPNNNIKETNYLLRNIKRINLNFIEFEIINTPGHTLDHIVYYCKNEKILFSGDTLFYYGCGRIFEGTNEQMLNSLNKIKNLPDDIKVYCGHEYTYKNLEFIFNELIYQKDKDTIKKKYKDMISKEGSSMPFNLGHQKRWNPFLNCNNINYKQEISVFHKNEGKIAAGASELDFFRYIREKRNNF